jgi:hypothetical protein
VLIIIQKRSYKQYPKEFKEEAVALVTEQGYADTKYVVLFYQDSKFLNSLR